MIRNKIGLIVETMFREVHGCKFLLPDCPAENDIFRDERLNEYQEYSEEHKQHDNDGINEHFKPFGRDAIQFHIFPVYQISIQSLKRFDRNHDV